MKLIAGVRVLWRALLEEALDEETAFNSKRQAMPIRLCKTKSRPTIKLKGLNYLIPRMEEVDTWTDVNSLTGLL